MDEAIIQHHFDEVFMALQDVENFEIFSRMKKIPTPKVRRTLVKIINPVGDEDSVDAQSDIEEPISMSKFASQLKTMLNRSTNNTPQGTPGNSRPSSRSSAVRKLITTPSKLKMVLSPNLSLNTSSDSTKSSVVKKLYSSSLMKREKGVELRNTLFECKYCGRFILGDFLKIHEENCGTESM